MALENYRDLSTGGADVNAGFQFEFSCARCSKKWRSAFKPYRMGQVTGLLQRFTFLFSGMRDAGRASGNFAEIGSRGAKDSALGEAQRQADAMYVTCGECRQGVCNDCFSNRDDACLTCVEKADRVGAEKSRQDEVHALERSAHACPNCSTPNPGGRFCPECGFDMASTHKACPACGQMTARQARFCTDCGHSF